MEKKVKGAVTGLFVDDVNKLLEELSFHVPSLEFGTHSGRKVIPFFGSCGIPLLRVLTNRSSEYCGNREHNEYALYLDLESAEHSRTKAKSPQTNGICERFNKTCKNEFYSGRSGARCTGTSRRYSLTWRVAV